MELSIAMIVKDEEKNIRRCLKAIEYLKGKITYEVIIVDTGSSDKTIEIARQFTEKVYEHPWTGNFGEMRNISIKYSKGDWILILDADEVLENPEELVRFLKSNESKKYNAAEISFKNLLSNDVNNYILASLFRLFKNLKDFYYVGRIHEQPRVVEPYTKSKVEVLHYGYSRDDYEVMRYKFERNKELLLKDLEKNIEPIYTRFQLAQTYSMANYHDEAFQVIKEAYELDKKRKDGQRNINVYHFYSRELLDRGEYEKAIEICNYAINYYKCLDFYYVLANSYAKLKKYKEALQNYKRYLEVHERQTNGIVEENTLKGATIVDYSFARKSEVIISYLTSLYEEKEHLQLIEEYEKIEDKIIRKKIEEVYIYALIYLEDYKKLFRHYENKVSDLEIQNILNVIEKVKKEKTDLSIKEITSKILGIDKILDVFIKEIYLEEEVKFDYNKLDFKNFYFWKAILLKKILYRNQYVLHNIKNSDKTIIDSYINFISNNYDCIKVLYEYSEEKFMTKDIRELIFVSIIEKRLLNNNSIDDIKYTSLVKRTKYNIINSIKYKYNGDIIKNEELFFLVDNYEEFWLRISYLIKNKDTDMVSHIRNFKKNLENMIEYKKIMEMYIKEIKTEPISEEMLKERDKLLCIVKDIIAEGKPEEALEIINQLNNLFIYDKDILLYRGVTLFLLNRKKEALMDLGEVYIITDGSFDVTYNIACILESEGKIDIAKYYFKEALSKCEEEDLQIEIRGILGE